MSGLDWMLAYMVIGAIYGCWAYGEEDTPGMVFLETFCWPLLVGGFMAFWISQRIVYGVDMLFELLKAQEDE